MSQREANSISSSSQVPTDKHSGKQGSGSSGLGETSKSEGLLAGAIKAPPTELICGGTGGLNQSPPPLVPVQPTQAHPVRCACGCVPAVLSLFEMAELRKKAKQEREAKK